MDQGQEAPPRAGQGFYQMNNNTLLTVEEREWLEAFRKLTEEQRELLLQIAAQLKDPADLSTDGVANEYRGN